jgi:RHS repeat-associated protein
VIGAEGSFTGFFRIEAGGELYIFNGDGQGGGDWLATGAKFATQEDGSVQDWIRLSLRQDFEQKVWDLFINGKIFRANLGFWKDAEVAPQEARFTLTGHTAVPLWVDDLKIDSDSVAFADADRDGLPDDWEVAQGLDATMANRDEDADGDGLTNAEELVVGTSAKTADTDEDGLSDGAEIASQGNPNRKDRWPRLRIEGPASWESVRHQLVLSVPTVVRGEPSEAELTEVLDTLDRQAARRDGSVVDLEEFVRSHAGSSLALWIEAHTARQAYRSSRFGRALPLLEKVWNARPAQNASNEEASLFGMIGVDLVSLYGLKGETEKMGAVLDALSEKSLPGGIPERVFRLKGTHWAQQFRPELAQRCGLIALHGLAQRLDGDAARRLMDNHMARLEGEITPARTLASVAALAAQEGMSVHLARRPSGAGFVIPSLVHLKVGHYAILTAREKDGSYILNDPARVTQMRVSAATLDEELSGACLIASTETLPTTWTARSSAEAEAFVGNSGITAQGPDDCGGSGGCTSCSPGVASASLNQFRASLSVTDTPLMDVTPRGPTLALTASWNQHSTSDLNQFSYTKLGTGANWSLGDLPYVDEDNGSADRQVFQGNGNMSLHVWNSGTSTFDENLITHQQLVEMYSGGTFLGFRLYSEDESYLEFYKMGKETSQPTTRQRRWLLTKQVDAQGNTTTIAYDGSTRISGVTGPTGAANLTYTYSGASYNVSTVSDSRGAGRTVTFAYNGAPDQLQSITDVVGIVSTFGYSGSFLNALTTPYGNSTFSTTTWGSGTGYGRFVQATDPRGWTERVLYSNGVPTSYEYDPTPDGNGDPNGSGDEVTRSTVAGADTSGVVVTAEQTTESLAQNQLLNWGSTWYWNKEAYNYHPPGDPSNAGASQGKKYKNFDKARHTHWMSTTGGTVALGVVSSTRGAADAGYRSFNVYQNQTNTGKLVDSSRVIKSVQRVKNEAGTVVDRLTQTAYNGAGSMELITDPVGRITKYEYDTNGIDLRFIKQQEGSGGWKVIAEHIYGGTGASPHKPTTIKNSSGDATTYEYNSSGQLKLEINAKSEKTRTNYDTNGFLTSIEKTDPANASLWVTLYTVNSRDSFKRVSSDTDALGYTKTYVYDALNRIERIDHPNPGGSAVKEEFFYTNNGLPSAKIIELGRYVGKNGATTRYYYNGNRQLSKVRDNLSQEVEYEYCRCGHMKLLIDERDKQTQWAFDLNGRVIEKTLHDGDKTYYTYQAESGLLETVRYPNDTAATWTQTYYRDGNLRKIDYANASVPDATYGYDNTHNRLSWLTDGRGTSYYYYHPTSNAPAHPGTTNGAGQLSTVDGPWADDTITYTYDDLGRVSARNMASASYPNHAHGNTYTFDSLGRLKQDINGLATYDYTFIGNSALVDKRSSGASTGVREVDYDYFTHTEIPYLNRPLKNIVHRSSPGGTVISRHDYTYGLAHELGQIKTWQRQLPNSGGGSTTTTQTFGYDNILQLTSAAETGQATKTYAYDAAGNRMTKAESGSSTTYAAANDVNQIASATGGDPHSGATYDDNGNLQSITYKNGVEGDNSKRTMAWDTINRLKEIIVQAGTSLTNGDKKVTWDYNADSQRYKEMLYTHNGTSWVLNSTVYFIWEGGNIIQKRIGATTAYSCTNYFQEGEMRCLNNAAPTKYYYTRDHLGSVYEMTNTVAAVQAAYLYVAYGERTKRPGFAGDTEIGYTGHWNFKPASFAKQAASDLSLTWFRAYDPKRGVWLSRDPMGEKGGINAYGMVGNRPIRLTDRSGLSVDPLNADPLDNGIPDFIDPLSTPPLPIVGPIGINPAQDLIYRAIMKFACCKQTKVDCLKCCDKAGAWYAATFGLLNSLNPLGAISNSDRIGKAVRDCKKNCK